MSHVCARLCLTRPRILYGATAYVSRMPCNDCLSLLIACQVADIVVVQGTKTQHAELLQSVVTSLRKSEIPRDINRYADLLQSIQEPPSRTIEWTQTVNDLASGDWKIPRKELIVAMILLAPELKSVQSVLQDSINTNSSKNTKARDFTDLLQRVLRQRERVRNSRDALFRLSRSRLRYIGDYDDSLAFQVLKELRSLKKKRQALPRNDWVLGCAVLASTRAEFVPLQKKRSSNIGAVLIDEHRDESFSILSIAYNGRFSGIKEDDFLNSSLLTLHAEENALCLAQPGTHKSLFVTETPCKKCERNLFDAELMGVHYLLRVTREIISTDRFFSLSLPFFSDLMDRIDNSKPKPKSYKSPTRQQVCAGSSSDITQRVPKEIGSHEPEFPIALPE